MVLARLVVFVIDVTVKVRFGTKASITIGMRAFMRTLMVALVMAKAGVSRPTGTEIGYRNVRKSLLQFVDLVKHTFTLGTFKSPW